MLFPTTIAGSLPKPEWLAEPNMLWAPWKSQGDELVRAKRDATMLAVKVQEDAGIDIVTEGEQARQHFVHGFLEKIRGHRFCPQGRDGHPQGSLQGDGAAGGRPAPAEEPRSRR
ncbi:methionine synthase II (cobalamin-independent) [Bradyrhizobium sp. LM6.9]